MAWGFSSGLQRSGSLGGARLAVEDLAGVPVAVGCSNTARAGLRADQRAAREGYLLPAPR